MRPSIVTKNVVAKLSRALRLGYNDDNACQYARIDRSTYYRHLQSDQGFATQMATARNYAKLLCCTTIMRAIEKGNVPACQWWLERRFRNEFGKTLESSHAESEHTIAVFSELKKRYTIGKPIDNDNDRGIQSAT